MPSAGEDRLCQQRDSGEEARGMERRVADDLPYRSSWLAMLALRRRGVLRRQE
jgi:hypothetical protein